MVLHLIHILGWIVYRLIAILINVKLNYGFSLVLMDRNMMIVQDRIY